MTHRPWSDLENDLTVASYFAMLSLDMRGTPYSKTEHRRALVPLLDDRSAGAVEFKHQNISAVLMIAGEPWIPGYKPAFNVQASLHDAIGRRMTALTAHGASRAPVSAGLIIGDAPPPGMGLKSADRPHAERIARKFDAAARDARNRALGRAGEEAAFLRERSFLKEVGRDDLARKVRWTSQEDGDGAGYDIASFSPDGRRRLIEVKTTNGWERTPFHISRNEVAAADDLGDEWRLMRVWDFARAPKAFEIAPPLGERLALAATSFSARVI